jgi:hypothetical protein
LNKISKKEEQNLQQIKSKHRQKCFEQADTSLSTGAYKFFLATFWRLIKGRGVALVWFGVMQRSPINNIYLSI